MRYYRSKSAEYRKSHPRLNLNFTYPEFETLLASATKYGIERRKLAKHAKLLVMEAARMGLGEQVERPPQLSDEVVEELQFLLHNCANNINQIAHRLNSKALEQNVTIVAGESESRRILDELFQTLKDTHTTIEQFSSASNTTQ